MATTTINITNQSYNTVKDESTVLPQRNTLAFVGSGVTAIDNGTTTVVTIPGIQSHNAYGIYTQTASSPVVTGTSEQSLLDGGQGSLTVPANGFAVGDSYRARMTGHISCANNQTLRIKIKADGVILADTGLMTLGATSSKHFCLNIEFVIRAIGAAGVASIASGGDFTFNRSGAGGTIEGTNFSVENSTTFSTTISNTLEITAQWGSSNAANQIYSEIFTLSKVF